MDAPSFTVFAVYIIVALLYVPTALKACEELQDGSTGYMMSPTYAQALAAISVALWPLFLILGLFLNWYEGEHK